MELTDIKRLKAETELMILTACKDFEKATGMNIEGINIIDNNKYVFAIGKDLTLKIEIKID